MPKERVIIVGLQTEESDQQFSSSMKELEDLVKTSGGLVVGCYTQKREDPDSRTFVGKGKIHEIAKEVDHLDSQTVVFNQALSPSQVRNIQELVDAKIIDRMQLILDIFAMRAKSREGHLQVELAEQEYLLPRLTGQGHNLSRLGGGIGTRGPGETQLESDRRYIQDRISDIKIDLKKMEDHRRRSRQKREANPVFQIGLVGYTNAGKSTIFNALSQENSLEEDALFATLNPLTRQYNLGQGMKATLTDTVGFIQDLPTEWIQAFQSTLEETGNMDLILHVVDASSDYLASQEDTVIDILESLDSHHIPRLVIYNKMDLAEDTFMPRSHPHICLSAKEEEDISRLKKEIQRRVKDILQPYERRIPAERAYELSQLQQESLLDSWIFDEEKNEYLAKGYAKSAFTWLYKEKKGKISLAAT